MSSRWQGWNECYNREENKEISNRIIYEFPKSHFGKVFYCEFTIKSKKNKLLFGT